MKKTFFGYNCAEVDKIISDACEKSAMLEEQINVLTERCAELEAELFQVKRNSEDIEGYKKEAESLRARLRKNVQETSKYLDAVKYLKAEREKLKKSKEKLTAESSRYRENLIKANASIISLQDRNTELSKGANEFAEMRDTVVEVLKQVIEYLTHGDTYEEQDAAQENAEAKEGNGFEFDEDVIDELVKELDEMDEDAEDEDDESLQFRKSS